MHNVAGRANAPETAGTGPARLYTSFGSAGSIAAEPDAELIELHNPADGSHYGTVAAASAAVVDSVVRSAREAHRSWMAMQPSKRTGLLVDWARLVEAHAPELAALDVESVGRVYAEALGDVVKSTPQIEYWAHEGPQLMRRTERSAVPGHLFLTCPAPVGLVALLLPSNVPSRMFLAHAAVALGCGNAIVVKPADATPSSALRLAELAVEAGLPAGLIGVVVGGGATGAALVAHDVVGGISFTGSTATGRRVAVSAAERFAKVALELGGKSPQIVFPDADLEAASEAIVWSFCANAGQICTAGTRALVHRDVYDAVLERVTTLVARVRVGDPNDPATHVGPLATRRQLDHVTGLVERGKQEARLVHGGSPMPELGGYYFQPTIFADVPPDAEIFQREAFGPVLCVTAFEDENEAIALANDSDYALASNVWTADLRRALRIAERIQAGTVWCATSRLGDPHQPIRAAQKSGNAHYRGLVDVFTTEKLVAVTLDEDDHGPSWGLAIEEKE